MASEYLVVLKVRSAIDANPKISGILQRLKLRRKLTLAVFPNTPEILNQIKEVKDYTTSGEIDSEFLGRIIEARGKEYKGRLTDSKKKLKYEGHIKYKNKLYKGHFHLHPPRGGFERKGIKKSFTQGGVLGARGEKIKELIERML